MSKAAPPSQKKRKLEDGMRGKISRPKKRIRKQRAYHSSSEDDDASDGGFAPIDLNDSDNETTVQQPPQPAAKPRKQTRKVEAPQKADSSGDSSEVTGDEYDVEDSDAGSAAGSTGRKHKVSKRNDPEAFSTSMSKILSTKLSQSARKDPVLSRSREAAKTTTDLVNEKLEHRARAKLRAEKKEDLQRGRVKDVLGLTTGRTGEVAEEEKRLRKLAQRGVVKLFNAVRAAQVRGEQALKEERKKGTVGQANREEKVNEMSKQGFLDLISGKKATAPKDA